MTIKKAISGDTNPDAYLTNYSFGLMQQDGVFVAGAASSRIPVTSSIMPSPSPATRTHAHQSGGSAGAAGAVER